MFQKISLGFVLIAAAIFAAACSGNPTPSTITLATVVPTAASAPTNPAAPTATAPNAVAPTTAAQSSNSSSALPQSLADAKEGSSYTFRVDPTKTTAEYAVNEVLFGNKQITRGSTNEVDGEFALTIKDGKPQFTMSKLSVNLQSLHSDNGMRDQMIQHQWLESSKYPTATFVATSVENVPSDAKTGQSYTFKVTGDMTIRDITKPVTFDVTVTLNGDNLSGQGTTQIYMKDFGFDPPEILGRFTVSDPATITVKGVANLVES